MNTHRDSAMPRCASRMTNLLSAEPLNMDYRSLYHHFENGYLFIGCDAVAKVREDFEEMFSVSREAGQDYLGSRPKKKDTAGLLKAVCTPYVR